MLFWTADPDPGPDMSQIHWDRSAVWRSLGLITRGVWSRAVESGSGCFDLFETGVGFTGSIKNFTTDFIVTEIDMNRKRVHAPALSPCPPEEPRYPGAYEGGPGPGDGTRDDSPGAWSCPGSGNVGHRTWGQGKSAEAPLKPGGSSDVRLSPGGSPDAPLKSRGSPDAHLSPGGSPDAPLSPGSLDLSLILGDTVSERLDRFIAGLKDGSTSERELSLGSFSDKHQRANVHRAVKLSFPFLMTTSIQSEITVKESPDHRELARLVSEEEADGFFRFIDAKVPGSSHRFPPDDDKEHRTAVHRLLSRRFGKLVETKTFSEVGENGRMRICARLRTRGRKRTLEDREETYTGFTLCKENLETLEAVSFMAAELGVLPSDFTYAGIKDKRAITFQSMVVRKVSPDRLMQKAEAFQRRGIRLSSVRPVSQPLRLGQLRGNHFDVVIRDVQELKTRPEDLGPNHGAERAVKLAMGDPLDCFVNYYGPQRFGRAHCVQSDQVGLALLKGNLVKALHVFFSPETGDEPHNKAKRHYLQTGNAKEALVMMPASRARERLMLRALNRYGSGPDGCAQAWLSLPHSSRIFYCHAYCSRLWNEAAQHRLKTFGAEVIRGDLVQDADSRDDDVDQSQIHVVTEQEAKDGVFALEDVLLPMPGNTVKYPENPMATWYRERLARDGLDRGRFRVSRLKMNVPGCYRPLLSRPRSLYFRTEREASDSPRDASDRDGLLQRPHRVTAFINFDLAPSSYATVFLREKMKCEVV